MHLTRITLTVLHALLLSAALALCAVSIALAQPSALPHACAGHARGLVYHGRFDWRSSAAPRCAWAGSSVQIAFVGTALNVRLHDSAKEDYFAVIVDGKTPCLLQTLPSVERYSLAAGLPRARHVVELFKRTEPFVGTAEILGFETDGRFDAPPAPLPYRLEIVGDSISCGFGNEGKSEKEPFSARTENNYMAYGAIAARQLRAEYACIAWSGKKMAPDDTLPALYDLTLPADPSSRYDFSWTPQAFVINLGTNDFRKGPPPRKMWIEAYQAFIRRLWTHAPQAHVFCCIGSMMTDDFPRDGHHLTLIRSYVNEVVAGMHDARVHFLEFAQQRPEDGIGAAWHPSVRTDEIMAATLVAALRRTLHW